MRPPRILIVAIFFVATVFFTFLSLRSSHTPQTIENSSIASSPPPKSGVRSFFSVRAPFSLFPPNAIITLTHENSTAFLARPAAFGPLLPTEGLKGQLWIGSGFGDDSIRLGAVDTAAEGELGCSDVPGWVESYTKSAAAENDGPEAQEGKPGKSAATSKVHQRSTQKEERLDQVKGSGKPYTHGEEKAPKPTVDDGTDDYLHHPLPNSKAANAADKQPPSSNRNHADIQSIQEGAEITGKVVLLSRGGCGFLEKVKWAQRRGAIALIVGDDTKGGPLIQMYARGDTSHVTIPSIFTSRTTAHLLSSLIGPGSFLEDTLDEKGQPTVRVHHTDKSKKPGKKSGSRPTFTPTTPAATKPTAIPRPGAKTTRSTPIAVVPRQNSGFFRSLFFGSNKGGSETDSSRPPSSGQLDWVLVDDWRDDDAAGSKNIPTKPTTPTQLRKSDSEKKASQKKKPATRPTSGDDFLIGIQDWRDPDLVGSKDTDANGKTATTKSDGKSDVPNPKGESPRPAKVDGKTHPGGASQEIQGYTPPLRGGSITPGSGEYSSKAAPAKVEDSAKEDPKENNSKSKGLLTTIFGDDEEDVEFLVPVHGHSSATRVDGPEEDGEGDDEYEGLWVTLTPTSGASPFLDTLLVLVVSPLVTLTVVYALLLVRSRIRRRRWRAPKSVVERLPVRTYQTINTSSTQPPPLPSPASPSVTTPLLQRSPTRPRPRSRTTTGVPEPGDLIRANSNPLQVPAGPSLTPEQEKHYGSESSQWRKYMGQQVECVVCLEEYVDGISRVMSLPCGHEFHVDCITPWLTTRRRTCPICKGDVVRSLARGSPSSPRYEPYYDGSDDDIQAQAAETNNMSPSSALPVTGGIDDDEDVEQGIVSSSSSPRPRRTNQAGSWRSLLSSSLGSSSRSPQRSEEDRDR